MCPGSILCVPGTILSPAPVAPEETFFPAVFQAVWGAVLSVRGTVLCARGAVLCVRGAVLCAPEAFLCVQGAVLCVPGTVLCAREAVLCVWGAVLCVQGAVLCVREATVAPEETFFPRQRSCSAPAAFLAALQVRPRNDQDDTPGKTTSRSGCHSR